MPTQARKAQRNILDLIICIREDTEADEEVPHEAENTTQEAVEEALREVRQAEVEDHQGDHIPHDHREDVILLGRVEAEVHEEIIHPESIGIRSRRHKQCQRYRRKKGPHHIHHARPNTQVVRRVRAGQASVMDVARKVT